MSEEMAKLAVVLAQSVLANEKEAHRDDEMTLAGHVAKSLGYRVGGDGSPQGSPNQVDPVVKQLVSFPQGR